MGRRRSIRWNEVMSVADVMTASGESEATVRDWMSTGRLKCIQPPGAGPVFNPQDVSAAIMNGEVYINDFSEVVADGLPDFDTVSQSAALDCDGTKGIWTIPSTAGGNVTHNWYKTIIPPDAFDAYVEFGIDALPTTGDFQMRFYIGTVYGNPSIQWRYFVQTTGAIRGLNLKYDSSGSESDGNHAFGVTLTDVADHLWLRAQRTPEGVVRTKQWVGSRADEPEAWDVGAYTEREVASNFGDLIGLAGSVVQNEAGVTKMYLYSYSLEAL